MNKLTFKDIQNAPTKYLKECLKYDLDVEIIDMITKEFFEIREIE